MVGVAALAFERQRRLISITDTTRNKALRAWRTMDFQNLDASWAQVGPQVVAQVTGAQLTFAGGSDRFTAQVATATPAFAPDRSAIVPQALAGVDGGGRDVEGILRGAVTTTKEAVGVGLGRVQSLEAGATYLAAIIKTVIADLGRSADLVSSAGKGYTHYVRVVNGSACSRCAILAGISSGQDAFLRHLSCQCSAVPIYSEGRPKSPAGLHASPGEYFDSLSKEDQDRVFTKAGAEAIRSGADPVAVINARRGAKGIGYSTGRKVPGSGFGPRPLNYRSLQKTTIGYRPNGDPVQVYATAEGTTVRGSFGKAQRGPGVRGSVMLPNARYSSVSRVRLMPEEIMRIAGPDLQVRQAFLRDAGYLEHLPPKGTGYTNEWITRGLPEQRRADRILVNKATLAYGNFTLG